MHFHTHSEHLLNDTKYDLELHLVHQLLDGPEGFEKYSHNLAVIGVMFKKDEESIDFIKQMKFETFEPIDSLNVSDLFGHLTSSKGFYHYQGSLTTPPCTESVNWFVYNEVQPISEVHLKLIKVHCYDDYGNHNYRETQNIGERKIVRTFDVETSNGTD